MNMSCIEIQEKMAAWLDGELSAPENRLIAKHLKTCSLCRNVRQQILAVQKLSIRALTEDAQPKVYWQNLTERIMSGVPASRAPAGIGLAGWIRNQRVLIGRGMSLVGVVALLVLVTRLAYFSEPVIKQPSTEDSLAAMQTEPVSDKRAKVQDLVLEKKETTGMADKNGSRVNQQSAMEQKLVHAPNIPRSGVNFPSSISDKEAQPTSVSLKKASPALMEQPSGISSKGSGTGEVGVAIGGVQTRKATEQIPPVSLSATDSRETHTGSQAEADKRFVIQTLEQAFESDDSAMVKDAKADRSVALVSAERKNHLLIKTAELYFSLVVENKVNSAQQQAIRFFQTHRQVLVDTLGVELYERRLALLNFKP
jgi:hypothetical protein